MAELTTEQGSIGINGREAVVGDLARMSTDQQQAFLSQLGKLSPEQLRGIAESSRSAGQAGDSLAARIASPSSETDKEAIDEQARHDFFEASKKVIPESEMNDTDRKNRISDFSNTYDRSPDGARPVEASDISPLIQHLADQGYRRDAEGNADAMIVQLRPDLTPEQRKQVIEGLPEVSGTEKAQRAAISDDEADGMAATASALGHKLEGEGEKVNAEIGKQLESLSPEDTEKKAQLLKHRSRVNGIITRMTDFFAPGEPGRDWARKIGKTIYWSLVIFFFIMIGEMNMISKASGRK